MFRDVVQLDYDDFITGEKFVFICDYVHFHYSHVPPQPVRGKKIFYTDTYNIEELVNILPRDYPVVVVAHNADRIVDDGIARSLPENVVAMFCQNVGCHHSKVKSIPIGLENEKWFPDIQKKRKMLTRRNSNTPSKLLYVNHDISTNPGIRLKPYQLLEDKPWATCIRGKNGSGFDEYIGEISDHFYSLSPEGNGIDCHRTWEILYMNRVPVMTRNANTRFYEDLPILFVDSWEQITEDFLISQMKHFRESIFNMDKLRFSYWKDKILCSV